MNPQDPNAQQNQNPNQGQPQYVPPQGQTSQQQQQARPQPGQSDVQPQIVYMTRPMEAPKEQMSPEIQQKHEESKRNYPRMNISEGEYVITVVKRNPIGLASIWTVTIAVVLAIFGLVGVLIAAMRSDNSDFSNFNFSPIVLLIPAALVGLLALLFGFVSGTIYKANNFVLTNESIIQHIQTSLFNMREQTISLASIEDVSYSQDGILPHLFNYGSIRLSTIGDEDTYRFSYASDPRKQIATLNNAVENFKNGRRVGD